MTSFRKLSSGARQVTVPVQPADQGRADTGLDQVLDRQLLASALRQLSPTHQVVVETYYRSSTLATVAPRLEPVTASSPEMEEV
jgi:hypothetical protein